MKDDMMNIFLAVPVKLFQFGLYPRNTNGEID